MFEYGPYLASSFELQQKGIIITKYLFSSLNSYCPEYGWLLIVNYKNEEAKKHDIFMIFIIYIYACIYIYINRETERG